MVIPLGLHTEVKDSLWCQATRHKMTGIIVLSAHTPARVFRHSVFIFKYGALEKTISTIDHFNIFLPNLRCYLGGRPLATSYFISRKKNTICDKKSVRKGGDMHRSHYVASRTTRVKVRTQYGEFCIVWIVLRHKICSGNKNNESGR